MLLKMNNDPYLMKIIQSDSDYIRNLCFLFALFSLANKMLSRGQQFLAPDIETEFALTLTFVL